MTDESELSDYLITQTRVVRAFAKSAAEARKLAEFYLAMRSHPNVVSNDIHVEKVR